MDLKNRKVQQVRYHYDPMIAGKPKQAWNLKEMGDDAHMELTPIGVYMKIWVGPTNQKVLQEHIVTFANTQSIMLAQEEKPAK